MTTNPTEPGALRIFSALTERLGLSRRIDGKNPKRNMDEVLRRKGTLTFGDYYRRYDRKDIAGRIIDAWSDTTWRGSVVVTEDDRPEDTAFEAAWKTLERRLRCSSVFTRLDKLASIGRYAVLLIGVKGGTALSSPLTKNQFKLPESVTYLSLFSEQSAVIKTWVTDPKDERFGRPQTYELDMSSSVTGFASDKKVEVHWTRIIHVAEDLLEDEVYGRPKLKRVYDLLEDLEKVVGGASEMFYQGADRGLHADVRDDFTLTPDDKKDVADQLEEYSEGLRRVLRTQGMDISALGGTTADPSGTFDVVMDLISGSSGIPKRILLGSERGELASTQDQENFYSRVSERRSDYAEPSILRAFIDRLLWFGALPPIAEQGYTVQWPSLFEQSTEDKLANTVKMATTNRFEPGTFTRDEIRDVAGYTPLEPDEPDEPGKSDEPGEGDDEAETT